MRGRFNKSHGSCVSFFAFQDVITATTGFLIIITIFLALNLDETISSDSQDAAPHAALSATLQNTLAEIVKLKQRASMASLAPHENEETVKRMIDDLKNSIDRLTPSTQPDASQKMDETPLDREIRIEMQKLLTTQESLKKLLPETTEKAAKTESELAALESELKEVQSRLQQSYDQQNVLRLIPEKSTTNKDPVLVVVAKSGFRIQAFDGSKVQSASTLDGLQQSLTTFPAVQHYIVLYFKPSGSLQFDDIIKRVRGTGYEIGYDLIPENIQLEAAGPRSDKP